MRKLTLGLIIFIAFAFSCVAQTESLLIGAGDLVDIDVFDTPTMTQEVRVTDAGTVPLALIGDVKVAGETPAAAAKIIEQALVDKKIMKNPQVAIKIVDFATQDVSILGQVKNPGSYPITTPQPLLKLIAQAGGLTDIADRDIVIERHRNSSERIHYYLANNAERAFADCPTINPGDTIIVPRAPLVYIMGDVGRPGGYPINTNDSRLTVLQAVAMAGSANKTAVQTHVRLIRKTSDGQEEVQIQLAEMQKGKKPDVVMQADDVLYVPFSWMKNMALSAASIAASTSGAAIYAIH
jgi:polysaccharide export outer membrane protein